MTAKLYYQNILIGNINNLKSDYPNLSGQFNMILKPKDDISKQIIEYIKFSSELAEFYLNTLEIDTNTENILLQKENLYNDLINSNDWRLINSIGEEVRILIPNFDKNGIVTYRFNTDA
ncbi:hypothetical protein V3468_14885 [Flavobacterium oreochromis]|uniref:hypothetical protein n=1 Tax=Flavobacterium oreochromis TaxID=2906078 RepID=UPI00385A5322